MSNGMQGNPAGNLSPSQQQYLQQQQIAQAAQHMRVPFQQSHPNAAALQQAAQNQGHHPQMQSPVSQFNRMPQNAQQQHMNLAMATQGPNSSLPLQYQSQQTPQHHLLAQQISSLSRPNVAQQQQQLSQVRGHLPPQMQPIVYNPQDVMQFIQGQGLNVMSPEKRQEYMNLNARKWELEMQLQKKQSANQTALEQANASRNYNASLEIDQKLSALNLGQTGQPRDIQEALYQQMQQHLYGQDQTALHSQGQGYQNVHQAVHAPNQDMAKRSTLSADAAEFVPRFGGSGNSSQPTPSNSGQSSASNQMPYVPPYMQDGTSLIAIQPEYASHPVVQQVDTAVVQLTSNPSRFDAIVRNLTNILSWQVKEENLMKEVVTVIFEQGVGEANFRFSGGKLCDYLIKNVQQQYNGLSFKSILLKRCQEEFEHRQEYLSSKYYERLTGFTYFLAEVMVKLLTPSGQPVIKLKEALCQMLNILLDIASTDSLKCSAQVLKMSGRYLEMGSSQEIEELIMKLRDIAMSTIPPHIQSVLMSVVELRAANWGVAGDQETTKETPPTNSETNNDGEEQTGKSEPVLGTVYYGPDGMVDHIEEDTVDEYQSDNEEARNQMPPVCELDGEEGAAFDEFLNSMK